MEWVERQNDDALQFPTMAVLAEDISFLICRSHFFLPIVSKGISHCLIAAGAKRRRTKAELQALKMEEQARAREVQAKLEEHERQ